MIQQAAAWFQVYEQVQVAIRPGLTARHGAEDAHIVRSVVCRDTQDLPALCFQEFVNPRGSKYTRGGATGGLMSEAMGSCAGTADGFAPSRSRLGVGVPYRMAR